MKKVNIKLAKEGLVSLVGIIQNNFPLSFGNYFTRFFKYSEFHSD